jgi:frataxin-like iron-binding protein CyaY
MMRDFNLTGDTQMTAIADQLEDALYGVNTDALKNSETLRLDKQQQVKDIISKLPSLDL